MFFTILNVKINFRSSVLEFTRVCVCVWEWPHNDCVCMCVFIIFIFKINSVFGIITTFVYTIWGFICVPCKRYLNKVKK